MRRNGEVLQSRPSTLNLEPLNQCWISVGNERREWRNGEMLLFDTSLMHQAANEADVRLPNPKPQTLIITRHVACTPGRIRGRFMYCFAQPQTPNPKP